MTDVYIIKLGGSIITDKKGGRPILRARRVKEIAQEVAGARSKGRASRLILLYGAGSFGHPLAHRFGLLDQPLSERTFMGVGYTVAAMRELGTHLSRIFLDAGIPVVPLQTSSLTYVRKGLPHFVDVSIIETILKEGGVPMLGGDVVIADGKRAAIASADSLAVELTRTFKRARLLFASDTDGVYATFPPRKGDKPIPKLSRSALTVFLRSQRPFAAGRRDVTGAMPGKLRALLRAHNTTAMIFNGTARGVLKEVFSGKHCGTLIAL